MREIIKYGETVAVSTREIKKGGWVHTHNLESQQVEEMNEITGYERKDGSFGIRNHVLVLPTVSCVNGVVNRISREVPEAVCVTHAHGCGRGGPRDVQILVSDLSGWCITPTWAESSSSASAVRSPTRKICSPDPRSRKTRRGF